MQILPIILLATVFCLKALAKLIRDGRYGGAAVILNKRIYVFGGATVETDTSKPFYVSDTLYYLDIENSFSVEEANEQWEIAPSPSGHPPDGGYYFGMDVMPKEQVIMIYGGGSDTYTMAEPARLYDAKNESWKVYPNPMPSLKQMQFGTLSRGGNGKAYIFGGRSVLNLRPVFPPFSNSMHIYDYAAGSWTDGATLPIGITVRFYTPVTLAGNELIYIGGMTANYSNTELIQDNIPVPLSKILIYNIDNNKWRQENATGNIPSNRIGHTIASKPYTNQVILYGGQTSQTSGPIEGNYCYTLDLNTMSWEKKNPIGIGPGPLYGHSAVFADRSSLLFVLFGVNTTRHTVNTFSVLNTESWTWTKDYQSSYTTAADPSSKESRGFSASTLAGAVIGSSIGVGIAVGLLVYFGVRKRNKTRQASMSDRPLEMRPEEARVVEPMSPLLPNEPAPAYKLHADDTEEHWSSDRSNIVDSRVPAYASDNDGTLIHR